MKPALLTLLFLLASLLGTAHAAEPEDISIPWQPGWLKEFNTGEAEGKLAGKLWRPEKADKAPFVIFLHGCGGLNLRLVSHWAEFFTSRGVGVLMVDSFATRGVTSGCEDSKVSWARLRADDAASALDWLAAQPFVRTDRIALMGQSQGGGASLLALSTRARNSKGFVGGITLYPACGYGVGAKSQFALPVLVMIGSDDNWTTPERCEELKAAQSNASHFELIIYPGAAHSFDNPARQALVFGKYKTGEHPESRDKARERVAQWVEARLR